MNRSYHFAFLKRCAAILSIVVAAVNCSALDNPQSVCASGSPEAFTIIRNARPLQIYLDKNEYKGVRIASDNLSDDFRRVYGHAAESVCESTSDTIIIVGSYSSPIIDRLFSAGKLDRKALEGKREKYIMQTVDSPIPGVRAALVIAGSDMRGTIYGIYELSEMIGVSPWYDWADVPVKRRDSLAIKRGTYTAGEPAVRYRGIFLNDEGPCLMTWVKNKYGTDYGDHRFYSRVFELILRLRGNFLWPAMWAWAFYADDPLNNVTADEMGVIIGTSHHEPMARNHQEYARNRGKYGKWDYNANRNNLDKFFAEGIRRMKGTEDIVTIGMRGDGDEAMSEDADVALLKRIISNQRKIISRETGRPAAETPQVWALYKEVLDYYDNGLRVPDDVTLLLCDDNWGNVRRLPAAGERNRAGGWGMYYHVDYVGAPRNSKWLNVTPVEGMWEQLRLTYDYGVDRLWILNVGDLKPMEYPITLFMDMAWNPTRYDVENFTNHTLNFCENIFGAKYGAEAARILRLYCKYNGRSTAEMLDADTYNIDNGEWRQVADEYVRLEAEALRLYNELPEEYRDAYFELILFPVQAMANLYDMYYAQAMNHRLYKAGDPLANQWAQKVKDCFRRDRILCDAYNKKCAAGKWDGMMIQKHIGYKSWNDDFPEDKEPEVFLVSDTPRNIGGYESTGRNGVAVIEAEHFFSQTATDSTRWTVIPDMGRTLSGVALMPYTASADGAMLQYRINIPECTSDSVEVHVIVKSTLDFLNIGGHCYEAMLDNGNTVKVNINSDLNEKPENIYSVFYPTVARRVIEKTFRLPIDNSVPVHTLTIRPLAPGIVFEKIVVDYGGYEPSHLYMEETPYSRQ